MTSYEKIRAINWSTLKNLAVSPLLYRHRIDNPEPRKQVYVMGSAIHCAILEPGLFDSRYAVFDGTRRGKEWDAWQAAHPGIESLKPAEIEAVHACAKAVRAHRHVAPLLGGGLFEETIEWTDADTGLRCKGRLDYLQPNRLTDLKTAKDISPRGFSQAAARYMIPGQLAWYWEGAVTAGRLPKDAELPFIVAIEKVAPYDCGVYQMTPEDMSKGVALYRGLLRRFEECTASGLWPGQLPEVLPLNVPAWMPGSYVETQEEEF